MGDLAKVFFQTHLPSFYHHHIQETCCKGTNLVLPALLPVLDSLLQVVRLNDLDLSLTLHSVLKDLLSVSTSDRAETLRLQSLLHALLYATPKYRTKRRFMQKTQSVLTQLRAVLAASSEPGAFRDFFMHTIVPRIRTDREAVETLAEALELVDEVEGLFLPCVLKRAPGSPTANPAKKVKEESPQHRAETLHLDSLVRNTRRNLQHDSRREVSVKMAPARVQLTPEHEESHISDSARAMKEVTKQFFYEKKKLSVKREDEGDFIAPKVLVTDTPKKEDSVRGRHVPAFRNIFS